MRHFEGPEAERWYALGMSILDDEMPEQVLSDGGYSELSPKYHAIVLEDLLDLLNAMQTFARKRPGQWADAIAAMRAWLATMLHARLRRRPHVFEGANPQVGRRLAAVTSVTVFCQTPDPSALHRAEVSWKGCKGKHEINRHVVHLLARCGASTKSNSGVDVGSILLAWEVGSIDRK